MAELPEKKYYRVDEVAVYFQKHVDGLGKRLMMDRNNKATSWDDIAKVACDYFAELAQRHDKKHRSGIIKRNSEPS